jgi:hypothetical protein
MNEQLRNKLREQLYRQLCWQLRNKLREENEES